MAATTCLRAMPPRKEISAGNAETLKMAPVVSIGRCVNRTHLRAQTSSNDWILRQQVSLVPRPLPLSPFNDSTNVVSYRFLTILAF